MYGTIYEVKSISGDSVGGLKLENLPDLISSCVVHTLARSISIPNNVTKTFNGS